MGVGVEGDVDMPPSFLHVSRVCPLRSVRPARLRLRMGVGRRGDLRPRTAPRPGAVRGRGDPWPGRRADRRVLHPAGPGLRSGAGARARTDGGAAARGAGLRAGGGADRGPAGGPGAGRPQRPVRLRLPRPRVRTGRAAAARGQAAVHPGPEPARRPADRRPEARHARRTLRRAPAQGARRAGRHAGAGGGAARLAAGGCRARPAAAPGGLPAAAGPAVRTEAATRGG
jgi:hypothetical protein